MPEKLSPWKDCGKIIQNEENLSKELSTPCINPSAFCVKGRRSEVIYLLLILCSKSAFLYRDAITNVTVLCHAQSPHTAGQPAFLNASSTPQLWSS